MKTLEQILNQEKKNRHENGQFGVKACKEFIEDIEVKLCHKSLYQVLEEYVKRANEDIFFNTRMVLACWELINQE